MCVCRMPRLEVLNISNNKLVALPEEVGRFRFVLQQYVAVACVVHISLFAAGCPCTVEAAECQSQLADCRAKRVSPACRLSKHDTTETAHITLSRACSLSKLRELEHLNLSNNRLGVAALMVCH